LAWVSTTNYQQNALVSYSSSGYPRTVFRCIRPNTPASNAGKNPSLFSNIGLVWLPVSTNYKEQFNNWSSSTQYNPGDRISYVKDGVYYGVFDAVNPSIENPDAPITVSEPPTTIPGISTSAYWNYRADPNVYSVLDKKISSQTIGSQNITGVLKFNGSIAKTIDSYAFLNLFGDRVIISIFTGNPVLTSSTSLVTSLVVPLRSTQVSDWYQYFYTEVDSFTDKTQVVSTGVKTPEGQPLPVSGYICFTVLSTTSVASAGAISYGQSFDIGQAQYGLSAGIIDYSTKEFDEFGDVTIVERDYSKRLSAELRIEKSKVGQVQRLLYSIRSKPVIWVASDDPAYEDLGVLYGFIRDFSTSINYPTHSMCSLEIEGLT
jgi:hypothetical protein